MPRRVLCLILSILVLAPSLIAQPVPTDPRLITGQLDNGLTYIIRRHDNPPGRAAAWLHVSTGSLNETDAQRGIAHFLEHMAFNGSEHFPPGSVIPFFESLGLTFGQHQNASTGFEHTVFQLALPDAKPETTDKALLFLSDVAFRLTLPPAEIDKERGVILEERRGRLGSQQRIQDYFLDHVAPGSLLGQRIPIGIEATINGMTAKDFHDYYSTWYTPSNMTLLIVADADPAPIIEQIKARFGPAPKSPRPADQATGIKPTDQTRAIVASDAELNSAQVGMLWISPPEPPATTVPLVKRDLIDSIAVWTFNRRLQQRVSEGKVSFQGGAAGASDFFRAGLLSTMSVGGEPAKWKDMLADLASEVQRARLHGFAEQELDDARKAITAAAEQAVQTDPTQSAGAILQTWNTSLANEEPIISAQQHLDLVRSLLPTITLADISARFNQLFDTTKPVTFSLTLPSSAQVPTEPELIAAGRQALEARPQTEAAAPRAASLLKSVPTPGKIVEESEHAASGVWSAWLDNGARVHHRHMDYKKDTVIVEIALADGEIRETAADRGITQAAAIAWSRPATGTLTSTNIRDLMTGQKVTVTPRPGMDQMILRITGTPAELETGFQLAYLLLTDPLIEPANFEQWQVQQRISAGMRKKQIEGAFAELLVDTLYHKDEARVRPLEIPQIDALTIGAAQARIRQIVASAPIEVAVVGDIDRARASELVRTYIGLLPARPRISDTTLDNLRAMKKPVGPLTASASFRTKADKALVLCGFFGADAKNLRDMRLMGMAARVLSTRAIAQIREERQLAYSPSVLSSPAVEFPGRGVFMAYSPTAPDKAPALAAAIAEMYDAFATGGPTPDELETARKQTANIFDEQTRDLSYWVNAMIGLSYRTMTLDDVVAAPEQYQAFTAQEIQEAFAKYHKPTGMFTISILPEPLTPPADGAK